MLTHFIREPAGNAIIAFGLLAPLLGAAVGIAVDYSDAVRTRAVLQSVADAASLAGATVLSKDMPGAVTTATQTAAKEEAARFATTHAPKATQSITVTSETVEV